MAVETSPSGPGLTPKMLAFAGRMEEILLEEDLKEMDPVMLLDRASLELRALTKALRHLAIGDDTRAVVVKKAGILAGLAMMIADMVSAEADHPSLR